MTTKLTREEAISLLQHSCDVLNKVCLDCNLEIQFGMMPSKKEDAESLETPPIDVVKKCSKCDYISHISAKKCYSCNHPFGPPNRILKVGARGTCDDCGSSLKRTFWGKVVGCIQPKCENYYEYKKRSK